MIKKKTKEKKKQTGKEILINVSSIEKRIAILDNNEMVDFLMERKGAAQYAGSIYKGKVVSVLPGMEAAFIDIGMEKNGFLHVSDVIDKGSILKEILGDEDDPAVKTSRREPRMKINNILKKGEELLVQVVKESIGTKGPRLTTFISIPGRYLVLTPYDKGIGISRRISDKGERKRIRDILSKMKQFDKVGCIVRTVAEGRTEKEFKNEINYLTSLWEKIKKRSDKQPSPCRVYEEYGIILRMVRDLFTKNIDKLVVDSKEEYIRINKFLKSFMPSLRTKVKYYSGKTSLFGRYNLDKTIDEIFERKVQLKSGGYLIIEQTEGVVVIDVNTGSFVGKRSLEQTALKTNLEAAEEIPKQLLLRDVGGIIIIDFIDMENRQNREKVFNHLQNKLHSDKARISVRAISQFGIVEMTRQRMRKSIEGTSHMECPYCAGKGMIKSVETTAIEAVRKIDNILFNSTKRHKHIFVVTHPDVNDALLHDQARMLSDIQRKYRCKIDLREDKSLHIEEVIVEER